MDKNTIIEEVTKLSKEDKAHCIQEILSMLSVLEMAELKKGLEEKWGVTASAPVAAVAAAPAAGDGGGDGGAEEATEFKVIFEGLADDKKKISVIKELREITKLGLKEVNEIVKTPPSPLKEGVSKSEAEEVSKKLQAAGAKIAVTAM